MNTNDSNNQNNFSDSNGTVIVKRKLAVNNLPRDYTSPCHLRYWLHLIYAPCPVPCIFYKTTMYSSECHHGHYRSDNLSICMFP